MNKLQITLVLVAISVTYASAQVGIGTPTPNASSVLDLVSTTKGFLPPRLTETERDAIVNPAEGLLIYNKTATCLQANLATDLTHQWSPCITGTNTGTGGGTGAAQGELSGRVPWETGLTFKNYHTSALRTNTIAVSTAGNVYGWGLESRHLFHGYDKTATVGDNILNGSSRMDSPFFIDDDLWNGKAKVARGFPQVNYYVVTTDGKLYGWGAESNNILNTGSNGASQSTALGTRKANEIAPHANSAAAKYVDILVGEEGTQGFIIALMDDGALYFRGDSYAGTSRQTAWLPINEPAAGVTYTKFLSHQNRNINTAQNFFVEASNGKVYSIGGSSSATTNNYSENRGNTTVGYPVSGLNSSINEVIFPAGVINGVGSITQISTSGETSIALASDGKAYGWGIYRTSNSFNYAFLVADDSDETTAIGIPSYRAFKTPKLISFPAGVTAFNDVAVNNAGVTQGSYYTAGNLMYFGGATPVNNASLIYDNYATTAGYKLLYSNQGIAARSIFLNARIVSFLSPNGVYYGLDQSSSGVTGSKPGTTNFQRAVATPLFDGNLDATNTSVGPGN